MHIEDRLSINEDLIKQHQELTERLSKRLESTEAQIRKLFAVTDELRPIVKTTGKSNETVSVGCNDVKQEDKPILEDFSGYKGTRLHGKVTRLDIICGNCSLTAYYMKKYGTRRVRMDKGNIVEIAYEFKCLSCKQPVIIYF